MTIASEHFKFLDRYKVQWSNQGGSRSPKKNRDGNYEDLWLFEC
jgi:hypothetical protein